MRFRRSALFETTPLALIGLSAIGFGVYLLARRDWVAGIFVILIGVTGGLPALEPLLARRERSASRIDLVAVDGNYRQGGSSSHFREESNGSDSRCSSRSQRSTSSSP